MRNKLLRRATVIPVVVLALAAGGGVVWATSGPAGPSYRTAAVTTGDVQQVLTQTGIVKVVNQVKTSFPVAGTVSTVPVHVGDVVTAGQALATIDSAPLTAAVTDAEATLATAKATLETDQ
ncbi:MAG: trimeric autotransporter adhesin, partial [Frankiaceae bacterium]|nr:trimeric autotransporter adhesin [Frankiaceae bacterium]